MIKELKKVIDSEKKTLENLKSWSDEGASDEAKVLYQEGRVKGLEQAYAVLERLNNNGIN